MSGSGVRPARVNGLVASGGGGYIITASGGGSGGGGGVGGVGGGAVGSTVGGVSSYLSAPSSATQPPRPGALNNRGLLEQGMSRRLIRGVRIREDFEVIHDVCGGVDAPLLGSWVC